MNIVNSQINCFTIKTMERQEFFHLFMVLQVKQIQAVVVLYKLDSGSGCREPSLLEQKIDRLAVRRETIACIVITLIENFKLI